MQRSLRAHDTPRLHARSAGCCLSRELGAATTRCTYFTEFRGRIVPLDLLYSHVDEAKVSLVHNRVLLDEKGDPYQW